MFVHLLDEQGRLLAQHDGVPAWGTRPTTLWPVDEWVLDGHRLVVPEEATAVAGRLVVGMYHTETVTRQLFANGEDGWVIAEVVFAR
jgi:hypothetical protein